MEPGTETEIAQILAGAELWARAGGPDGPGAGDDRPTIELVAGWEDGHPPCAPFAGSGPGEATGPGTAGEACHRCPTGLVERVLATRRAASEPCPHGVRLLAFPAPAGAAGSVAVLRLAGPGAAGTPRLPAGATVHRAAHRLRDPAGLTAWQAEQRMRGATRLRTATDALTRLVAATEVERRGPSATDPETPRADDRDARLVAFARESVREAAATQTRAADALHDTAGQSMVAAHRFLEAARASLAASRPDAAAGQLDAAQERLLAAIREVRAVLVTLVPPGLEELGLPGALEIMLRERVPDGIATTVTGQLPRLARWLELDLLTLTRQAVERAASRPGARTIHITLRAAGAQGIITVTDDGADQATDEPPDRADPLALGRRVAWLGGEVELSRPPEGGTTIRIAVPIETPEASEHPDAPPPAPGASR